MPCTKCNADFTLLTWKIRCIDCEKHYCSKCLRKIQGGLFCEKCVVLNKRPPDRDQLMELRAKDLREYLNKNNISTHGLVEKGELVELLCRCTIPARNKKQGRFSSVFSGSVPNLASQSQEHIHSIRTNIGTNINNVRSYAEGALHDLGAFAHQNIFTSNGADVQSPNGQTFFTTNGQTYFYMNNSSDMPEEVRVENQRPENHRYEPTAPHQEFPGQQQASSESNLSNLHKIPKLSDFETAAEISELSVKQLKQLLTFNRVDYKGCVEKTELLDRAVRLWDDNNQHRSEDFEAEPVDNLCKICMDAPLDCVILECGHMATCINCGKQLAECPICRQYVTRVVRTFKA